MSFAIKNSMLDENSHYL